MAKDDKQAPKQDNTVPTQKQEATVAGNCPDCKGEGLRNPSDTQVCATCEGRGTV